MYEPNTIHAFRVPVQERTGDAEDIEIQVGQRCTINHAECRKTRMPADAWPWTQKIEKKCGLGQSDYERKFGDNGFSVNAQLHGGPHDGLVLSFGDTGCVIADFEQFSYLGETIPPDPHISTA